MTRVLKKIAILCIIGGVVGIVLNMLFGANTITYLTRFRMDNGYWLYKYDFNAYMVNLSSSLNDTTKLTLTMPDLNWSNDIIQNLSVIVNILIMIANVIFYPFRISFYLVEQLLALAGVQTINISSENGLKWLIDLCNFMQQLQIPYVS